MSQPTLPVLAYFFQSELGTPFGSHLDSNFDTLVTSIDEVIQRLALAQRDDGYLRNNSVGANTLTSDALALMAGSAQASATIEWLPRGAWITATLYNVGNIIETGSPLTAYVCAVQHTSGVFATDYAANKWVVLSSPRVLTLADVTTALTFTPVNRAGDTMTGPLILPTGSKVAGAAGMSFTDPHLAQDLVTVNAGIYSVYGSTASDIVYGFAANVVRLSGTDFVVGGQFSGYGSGASATGTIFGGNINAFGLNGFVQSLIGLEIDVGSFDPNNPEAKRGLNVIFFNRASTNPGSYSWSFDNNAGTHVSTGAGLGSNFYNREAFAVQIDSQARSAIGEFCGWNKGVYFTEYALDYAIDSAARTIPAIGVDFSQLHYFGGSDPTVAYRMDAAIALRDLQTIWWNRDPSNPLLTNKVRTYFNVFTNRWVLMLEGVERFGIDVNNGDIYQNGAIFSSPTLTGNNVWSGTNAFNAAVSIGADLTFAGAGRRIKGDFTNATLASRTVAQTSTANSPTEFGVIPSGSATGCGFYGCSDALLLAGVVGRVGVDSTGVLVSSTVIGGGTVMPLDFGVGASVVQRMNSAGQVMIGTTTAPATVVKLRVNGAVQVDQPVAFSAHRNGVGFNLAENTLTVIDFTTEEFDTNASYDVATNRFTPPAGKYQLMGAARTNASSVDAGLVLVMVYKNGAQYKSGIFATVSGAGTSAGSTVSCLADANGTDYFELVAYQVNSTATTLAMAGQASDCWFQGYKVS